ncbi:uncharacterized protein LOC144626861 isoform X2 [Crassostrea virginica]
MGDRYCFSHGNMENEYCRRRSFSDLEDCANLSLSPRQLAQDGFYYIHETGEILCYFCGFVISDRSTRVMPSHSRNSNCDIPRQHGDSLMVPSGQHIDHQHRSRSPQLHHHRRHWQSPSPDLHHHTGHWQTPAGDRSRQTLVNHASPSACDRTRPYEVNHASPSACFRTRQAEVNHARPSDTAFTCQQGFSEFVRLNKLKKGQEQILERESVEVEGCAQSEESSETLATVSNQVTAPDLPNHIQLSKRVKNCSEGPQMYWDRKATLESMPFSLPLSPDILAAAGFYYEVDCQRVMCFSCGGFLQTSASDTRTTDAGHSPGCKHVSSPQQTLEPSSQPASLTDTEIASLPMVQEMTQYSFDVPDIVNAYRELNNTLDIRNITMNELLMYMFEGREDIHDNSEPCLCCVCCCASICVMCLPCRHGCCHDCKLRLLNRCLKCDEIIKAKINVFVP